MALEKVTSFPTAFRAVQVSGCAFALVETFVIVDITFRAYMINKK